MAIVIVIVIVVVTATVRRNPGEIIAEATLGLQLKLQPANPSRNRIGELPGQGNGNENHVRKHPERMEFGNLQDDSAKVVELVVLLVLVESDDLPEEMTWISNGVVLRTTKEEMIAMAAHVVLEVIDRQCVALPTIGTIGQLIVIQGATVTVIIAMIVVRFAGEQIVLRCAMVIGPEECVGMAATGTVLVIGIVAIVATLLAVAVVTIAVDRVAMVATAIERALGAVLMVEVVVVAKRVVLVAVGERLTERNRPNPRRKSAKNDRGKLPEPLARMRTAGRT